MFRGEETPGDVWVEGEGKDVLAQLQGALDKERVYVMGHSFGGATSVLTLATDTRCQFFFFCSPCSQDPERHRPGLLALPTEGGEVTTEQGEIALYQL